MKLITHVLLVSRLNVNGVCFYSKYVPSWRREKKLLFNRLIIIIIITIIIINNIIL